RRPGRGVVATVALPANVAHRGHVIHPAFLDACLHAYLALVDRDASDGIHLPVGFERCRIFREAREPARVHVVAGREPKGRGDLQVDIRVADSDGRPIARIDGLRLHWLRLDSIHATATRAPDLTRYEVRWERRERPHHDRSTAPDGCWLIFTDKTGVGEALARHLKARGVESRLIEAGPRSK